MTTNDLGFRIVGPCTNERRLVDWQAAFVGYATLDERAEVNRDAYLSAFTFDDDFRQHLDATGSTKGFDGVCGARFVWFDIDREDKQTKQVDLEAARRDAARLCLRLIERSTLDFIRNGAGNGDRHRLLFSAAANLAEFGCPSELALELLNEAALDSGLLPSEVRRQIECGLKHQ